MSVDYIEVDQNTKEQNALEQQNQEQSI